MTKANEQLAQRFIDVTRASHGDVEANGTSVEYSAGWWTIKHEDGAEEKLRSAQLEGRVDQMEQTLAAKAKAADIGSGKPQEPFGYLTWWTIHRGMHDVEDLTDAADAAGVPSWISGSVQGAKPESAWLRATQLGAKGKPSADDDPNHSARFLVRDAGEEDRVRILIRETVDADELTVRVQECGFLSFSHSDGVKWEPYPAYDGDIEEVDRVVDSMRADYHRRVGKVDDGRIRNAIFRWLQMHHRVCVRGTGGVYFIPNPKQTDLQDELTGEVTAIRNWVNESGCGTFSVVAAFPGGMTTIDDFRKSADDDLQTEIQTVIDKLDEWDRNQKMNAGSRMYSASTQMEALDQLGEKLALLEESLETTLGTASATLEIARKRALDMMHQNQRIVEDARTARRIEQEKEREARRQEREAAKKSKKSGTAKERKSKKSL